MQRCDYTELCGDSQNPLYWFAVSVYLVVQFNKQRLHFRPVGGCPIITTLLPSQIYIKKRRSTAGRTGYFMNEYIFCLFNDAFSTSDYFASNDRIIYE
jgi:hypothetical protein